MWTPLVGLEILLQSKSLFAKTALGCFFLPHVCVPQVNIRWSLSDGSLSSVDCHVPCESGLKDTLVPTLCTLKQPAPCMDSLVCLEIAHMTKLLSAL